LIKENKILVHGGGKVATEISKGLGIEAKMVEGRRITDAETLKIVTMVYGGLINKRIVALLTALKNIAIGLTKADTNIIQAKKRPVKNGIDYGFVGDITPDKVNIAWLGSLLKGGVVPVFAPLTCADGVMLNTNADTIASVLAVALSREFDVRLIYCFEKKGVLQDVNDPDSVIRHLPRELYRKLLAGKALADGILPKLDNAYAAIDAGVREVLIGEAGDIRKNTGEKTQGTLITA